MIIINHINTEFCISRPPRDDPCDSLRSVLLLLLLLFFGGGGGGGGGDYCMMIEIAQMALSYYLSKL